ALCLGLAVVTLVLKGRSIPWLFFSLGMFLLAADSVLSGLALSALTVEGILAWQKLRLAVVALLPVTWLLFSLCYSRGNYREFLTRWRAILVLAYAIPIISLLGFSNGLIRGIAYSEADQNVFIGLGLPGKTIYLILLLGSV